MTTDFETWNERAAPNCSADLIGLWAAASENDNQAGPYRSWRGKALASGFRPLLIGHADHDEELVLKSQLALDYYRDLVERMKPEGLEWDELEESVRVANKRVGDD